VNVNNCSDVVKKLLSCHATLDVLCAYPSPPTYLFGYKPQLDTDDSEDYTRVGSVQVSPVIQAVLLGNFEMTQELIRRGASVNFADTNGRTPLMAAISVVNHGNFHLPYSCVCLGIVVDAAAAAAA